MGRCLARSGAVLVLGAVAMVGCHDSSAPAPQPQAQQPNDQIVAAGQFFHVGTPVVLWTDPGGYDAYRTEASAVAGGPGNTRRYGLRVDRFNNGAPELTAAQRQAARDGDWSLDELRQVIDQLVIHYDAAGLSRECFRVLQDQRGLSAHFLIDIDGTIYQTLDLQERAWHAGVSNSRSIGIEIANIGAFDTAPKSPADKAWYAYDAQGRPYIDIPAKLGDGGVRTANFVGRPARNQIVKGNIQGQNLQQYDFTDEQYEALVKLTAALNRIFPKIELDAPRDSAGRVTTRILTDEQLRHFHGIVGHYHISKEKIDPGPAFDWDRVIDGATQQRLQSAP